MKGTILVADDESYLSELIRMYLEKEQLQVLTADNGLMAIDKARRHNPDLIILDVMMPRMSGIETCRELRRFTDVPILFLSCRGENIDKVIGLEVGADDYITKPFDPGELVARVKANLRRSRMGSNKLDYHHDQILHYGNLEINLTGHEVRRDGITVDLTPKEFQLLAVLAESPNHIFSFEQLFTKIWNYEVTDDYRTVMVHIRRLRTKIEPNPSEPVYIVTVRGAGYKFSAAAK